jgi:hypothetical protein
MAEANRLAREDEANRRTPDEKMADAMYGGRA